MKFNAGTLVGLVSFCAASAVSSPASAASIVFTNLNVTNEMAAASRPDAPGTIEIEAADDFVLESQTIVTSASFVGLIVGGTGTPSISDLVVEMYRVFPNDSNVARTSGPPTFATSQVPTRVNSPSDVAFASRDSASSELTFTSSVGASFTALNSVQPGGIHPMPGQTTGGNGPLTGQEVQINVTLTVPFNLPADHFFFVPQVALTGGAQFYWLSASRPIMGTGTTPFPPGVTDLQSWTRDAMLDPDWLRVGMDIVGGNPAPTFNQAFSLDGTVVPEPGTIILTLVGIGLVTVGRLRRKDVDRN